MTLNKIFKLGSGLCIVAAVIVFAIDKKFFASAWALIALMWFISYCWAEFQRDRMKRLVEEALKLVEIAKELNKKLINKEKNL